MRGGFDVHCTFVGGQEVPIVALVWLDGEHIFVSHRDVIVFSMNRLKAISPSLPLLLF